MRRRIPGVGLSIRRFLVFLVLERERGWCCSMVVAKAAGEENRRFFEELQHQLRGETLRTFGSFSARIGILPQELVCLAIGIGVGHLERDQLALRELGVTGPVDNVGLEAPHHDGGELAGIGTDAALKSLVVEQLQERSGSSPGSRCAASR